MSIEQFKQLVSDCGAEKYFDWETMTAEVDLLYESAGCMSTGEWVMTKFALSVWFGRGLDGFDILSKAHALDEKNLKIISDWFRRPFYP